MFSSTNVSIYVLKKAAFGQLFLLLIATTTFVTLVVFVTMAVVAASAIFAAIAFFAALMVFVAGAVVAASAIRVFAFWILTTHILSPLLTLL